MSQTKKEIYKLIGDIREPQVSGQVAIKLVAKKRYTETQALIIAMQKFNEIGNVLREFEKTLIEEKIQPKEEELWNE